MKIAVLSYGSLTLNLQSQYFETALSIDGEFEESGLMLQTSFQDISSLHAPEISRVCLLANRDPSNISRYTKLYYALHAEKDLKQALENFMKREGTSNHEDVAIIRHPRHNESSTYSPLSFYEEKILEIEKWLVENDFDFALIAQFTPHASFEEIQAFLHQDEGTKLRTLHYYNRLPKSTREAHRDALELLGLNFEGDYNSKAI